jgi:hypothetical protein
LLKKVSKKKFLFIGGKKLFFLLPFMPLKRQAKRYIFLASLFIFASQKKGGVGGAKPPLSIARPQAGKTRSSSTSAFKLKFRRQTKGQARFQGSTSGPLFS